MQNCLICSILSIWNMLVLLVLKNAVECTSQRLKWTTRQADKRTSRQGRTDGQSDFLCFSIFFLFMFPVSPFMFAVSPFMFPVFRSQFFYICLFSISMFSVFPLMSFPFMPPVFPFLCEKAITFWFESAL